MNKFLAALVVLGVISGCATALTPAGSVVRVVQNQSDHSCSFIGTVSGANSTGASTAHDTEGAMNQVRNKASEMGGNAIRILNISTTIEVTTVAAEALRCEP